ncbi:hypothetical protein VPH184E373B_0095 [Vibrio phage 184E37-3b]|nr:hypothetical protein MYOV056v2_p0081 [Vibrio phage 184E37.3a]QZI89973.1 hypothetical protein MYOV057v1_p0058 [Vibrio phage 184E37.1]
MKQYLWFVGTSTGYVGMDQYDVVLHEATDDQNEDLGDMVWIIALEQAQSYGIERYCGQCEDCEEQEYDDCEEQEQGIEGWAELYNPDDHDGKRVGGGSFLDDHEGYLFDEKLDAYYVDED